MPSVRRKKTEIVKYFLGPKNVGKRGRLRSLLVSGNPEDTEVRTEALRKWCQEGPVYVGDRCPPVPPVTGVTRGSKSD